MTDDFKGISPHDTVTLTKTRHILEVQYLEKMNTSCNIRKLDKDRYMVIDTGEIHEFKHTETRDQSYNSLRQTFKKIRYYINNNFEGHRNELHVTLTYAENVTDPKQLYSDFDKFFKRLRYKFKATTSIDYMSVVEPQERGAWHCHVLLRFNDLESVFIPNKELAELWGHGFVTIKALKDVDNIGAYLSAYLADVEMDSIKDAETIHRLCSEQREVVTKVIDGEEKRFIKGGRLHMYPAGMNLFRRSKGILFPERQRMTYQNAKKECGSLKPHYSKTYTVDTQDFQNTIHYEQYNLKRTENEQ